MNNCLILLPSNINQAQACCIGNYFFKIRLLSNSRLPASAILTIVYCLSGTIVASTLSLFNHSTKNIFMEKIQMTTLSSILEKLRLKRQDNEFTMTEAGFTSANSKFYQSEDLTIIKTYRFEGESDPADSTILYLIEANDGLVGYSIDTYGVYSNHDDDGYDDFIKKIKMEDREFQLAE
jgi:hypothetical protein